MKPTQQQLSDFVSREVIYCQSTLVDELLKKEIFDWDCVENLYDDETNGEGYSEEKEVFEWWLCSGWMIEKLKEEGEPILENDYGSWWGRTCTGQSISLDYVIEQIYTKLYGTEQEHDCHADTGDDGCDATDAHPEDDDTSDEYPLGGTLEPHDIEVEKTL